MQGREAFIVVPEPTVLDELSGRTAVSAAQYRLPSMYQWKRYVEAGGLMSYGPSLPDWYRRFAHLCGSHPEGRQARRLTG